MNFFIKFFDNYAKICLGIYPLRKIWDFSEPYFLV